MDRPGMHSVLRPEPVHINPSMTVKLGGKLTCQGRMEFLREISQCISDSKPFFLACQDVFPAGGMAYIVFPRRGLRKS